MCRSFLIQCSLVFEQQMLIYTTDNSKISYIMGLLKGADVTMYYYYDYVLRIF